MPSPFHQSFNPITIIEREIQNVQSRIDSTKTEQQSLYQAAVDMDADILEYTEDLRTLKAALKKLQD